MCTDGEQNTTNYIIERWGLKLYWVSFCFMFRYVFNNVIQLTAIVLIIKLMEKQMFGSHAFIS